MVPAIRSGIKTTELWVGLIVGILITVQKAIFPHAPFPEVEMTALITWVVARFAEKGITPDGDPIKRAWRTSEFWVAIGFTVVRNFIDVPPGVENFVYTYVVGKPLLKTANAYRVKAMEKKNPEAKKATHRPR